jgi:hypothetical protein
MRAVKAALAIIDKAALIGLPVGAGVVTGPAIAGRLADSANVSVLRRRHQPGVTSPVIGRGRRNRAELGEAYRRVREWTRERGPRVEKADLMLKGFERPVPVLKVEARAGIKA